MSESLIQALEIAGIGLPVMFLVIGIIALTGQLLLKVFPEKLEHKE